MAHPSLAPPCPAQPPLADTAAAGPPRKLTPRQEERRRRILAVAQAQISELGYEAMTMRGIAAASGTAEKTLYNIFGTKDRLVAQAARYRSGNAFAEAARRAGQPGWDLLLAFCDVASEWTQETPILSRGLALVLADHAELVGLGQIYETYVGASLRAMMAGGMLAPAMPLAVVVRVVRLAVVATVVFWARGELSDAELRAYLRLRMAESLLPHAAPGGGAIIACAQGATRQLADLAASAPAMEG
ncbi:MAG TPA: TetR/AcrR family transcriptional regulator [Novosphingobium sp.]|nr:TetR/AcrR family transcriptional regulator [Novosphingobium sp.]